MPDLNQHRTTFKLRDGMEGSPTSNKRLHDTKVVAHSHEILCMSRTLVARGLERLIAASVAAEVVRDEM